MAYAYCNATIDKHSQNRGKALGRADAVTVQ